MIMSKKIFFNEDGYLTSRNNAMATYILLTDIIMSRHYKHAFDHRDLTRRMNTPLKTGDILMRKTTNV